MGLSCRQRRRRSRRIAPGASCDHRADGADLSDRWNDARIIRDAVEKLWARLDREGWGKLSTPMVRKRGEIRQRYWMTAFAPHVTLGRSAG